jgi:N-carbamoyl-L-amino-acid hydrolase
VELRDLVAARIEQLWARIERRFGEIAREERVSIACTVTQSNPPALTDAGVRNAIREAARTGGFSTFDLPSGAGHDAQQVSRFAPMGMIFVPSRQGISHSPREYSSPQAVTNGAEVLYRTIVSLDATLDSR